MSDLPDSEPEPGVQAPRPMPWENAARSWLGRFWGTFGNALTPVRGVPALCSPVVLPAWTFALLSALPLMLASGVIPFTRTVTFGPSWQITPTGYTPGMPLWLDVLTAVGLGLSVSFVSQLAWALPFRSLLKAFVDARVPAELSSAIAMRFVLYRAWLVPFGMLAFDLSMWALPASLSEGAEMQPTQAHFLAFFVFKLAPPILVLLGAQATAATLGAGLLGALAVAIVPAILQAVVGMTIGHYTSLLVPLPGAKTP
jgi:hypothetical protein